MIHFANKNPYTGFKFWVPKWQTFSFIDNLVTEPNSMVTWLVGQQGLQWATKAVETLLGNDAFRYLSICSILFASSVNSLGEM